MSSAPCLFQMPRRTSASLSPIGVGPVNLRRLCLSLSSVRSAVQRVGSAFSDTRRQTVLSAPLGSVLSPSGFAFVSVLCAVCRIAGCPLSDACRQTALFSPLGLVLSSYGFALVSVLCAVCHTEGCPFSDARRQTALFSPLGLVLSSSGFALVSALCAVCRLAGRFCPFRCPAARRGFTWCSHGGSPGATRPCYNRAIPEQRKGSPPAGTPAGNPESAAALPQGGGFLCERSPLPCCPVRPPVPDTPKAVTKPVPPGNCTVRSVPEKHAAAGPIWSITAAGVPTLNGAAGGWIPTGHSGNSLPVTHLPGGVPAAAGFCRSEGFLSWIIFLYLPHRACRCAAFSVFWCWAPVICSCVG